MACGQSDTKLITASSDLSKIICKPCDAKTRETNASVYCVECNEYFCETCSEREHIELPDKHVMVSREDFLKRESEDESDACDDHPGLVIDMVCVSPHNQVGCNLCMQMNHSDCQLRYIIHHMEAINFNSGTHLKEMEAKLASTVDELQAEMTKRMEAKTNFDRQKQEARQAIAATARRLGNMVDALERKTVEALSMKYENMDNELAQEGLTIEDQIESIEARERVRDENPCEETERSLQEAMEEAEKMINDMEGNERTLEFIPDTSILDTIRSCDSLLTAHVSGLEHHLEDRAALGSVQETTGTPPEEGLAQGLGDGTASGHILDRTEVTSEEAPAQDQRDGTGSQGLDKRAVFGSVQEPTKVIPEEASAHDQRDGAVLRSVQEPSGAPSEQAENEDAGGKQVMESLTAMRKGKYD